ncbi:MAG: NAD(P)-dependent oxidoreductase [Flavobacteriales bacterium]
MQNIKIGILKERKTPADRRVPLSPDQCLTLSQTYPFVELQIEKSPIRCFSDKEYSDLGLNLVDSVSDCDILLGVKEVPKEYLISNKTYLYFSHTIKKQSYNRELLAKMINQNITMIDYETLCDKNNNRIIGFGFYAGLVGCYNGFLAYGLRTNSFHLKPAIDCFNKNELFEELKKVSIPNLKIILTGNGRVASGALEILKFLKIKQIGKDDFLNNHFDFPVFVQLSSLDFNIRLDGKPSSKSDFYSNPENYKSIFPDFAQKSEFFIAGHFYANNAPFLFTRNDAKSSDFKIRTIADISCDINGPVASTIRSSSIENPIYGYNVLSEKEDDFNKENVITVMAVDNLPCELPKDASIHFGNKLIENVFPALLLEDNDGIIERSTICKNGSLTPKFRYLKSFVEGS